MKRILIVLFSIALLFGCSSDSANETGIEDKKAAEEFTEDLVNEVVEESNEEDNTSIITDEPKEEETNDPKSVAESNANEHPAAPGKKLFGEEFKGMQYYFTGELIKTETVEGLFGEMEEALLVKNSDDYIFVIFPNYEIPVKVGDEIEAWGPLNGDGYSSSDLGIDNVVGVTGAINASIIHVNGEMQ